MRQSKITKLKRFPFLLPFLLLTACVMSPQKEVSNATNSVSDPAISGSTPVSRIRVLRWGPYPVHDRGGELATQIENFTVRIIEVNKPNLITQYALSWDYHNFTQDDKTGSVLHIYVSFFDSNNIELDRTDTTSPRKGCTYDPPWIHMEPLPRPTPYNFFDNIDHATLQVNYSSSYEGKC